MPNYVDDLDNPGKKVDVIELQLRDPNRELPPIVIQGWLKRDLWTRREAMLLLAGFDPDATTWGETNGRFNTIPSGRIGYLDGTTAHQLARTPNPRQLEALGDFLKLTDWSKHADLDEALPPRQWLAWAKVKGHLPYWQEWATHSAIHRVDKVSKFPAPINPLPDRRFKILKDEFQFIEPDWKRWNRLDIVLLWQATCLAANIEPPKPSANEIWYLDQLASFPPSFHEIWEAVNGDQGLSLLPIVNVSGRMLHRVHIDEFAYWAESKGFSLPKSLSERARRVDVSRLQTLQQGTGASEQRADTGLQRTSHNSPRGKLKKNEEEILKALNDGASYKSLADKYGVSKTAIGKIARKHKQPKNGISTMVHQMRR